MTSSDSSPSGIRVSLNNVDLWKKLYPNNEMIVKKSGRKLFPNFEVKIEGLDPKELYTVSFYLERVDNIKYAFSKVTGRWGRAGNGDKILPINKKQPLCSWEGAYWMSLPISFSSVCITTDPDYKYEFAENAPIFVSSMHKYQPVITVKRVSDGMEEEFRLTMTEFMVVTHFKNPEIAKLKKDLYFDASSRGKKRVASSISPPAKKRRSLSPVPTPTSPLKTQKQIKVEPVSPPSSPPPIDFQDQMIPPPNMAPPKLGSNNFQNPVMPLPGMIPAHHFAMNQFWNPYGPWNMPPTPMAPLLPPQPHWNMMHGGAQIGQPGFPQYPNFVPNFY